MASMAARSNPEGAGMLESASAVLRRSMVVHSFRCNSGCRGRLETAPKPYDFYHGVLIIAQFSSMANDIAPKCFLSRTHKRVPFPYHERYAHHQIELT